VGPAFGWQAQIESTTDTSQQNFMGPAVVSARADGVQPGAAVSESYVISM
jgi:hypothetical protein